MTRPSRKSVRPADVAKIDKLIVDLNQPNPAIASADKLAAGMRETQMRPRWIVIRYLLQALEMALADPLVQTDPVAVAEVQALHDAVANLPIRKGLSPGAVLDAITKQGQQQTGKRYGSKRADPIKRQIVEAMAKALPADPAKRPSHADFVKSCVEASDYTPDGVRKALKAIGIPRW